MIYGAILVIICGVVFELVIQTITEKMTWHPSEEFLYYFLENFLR